MFLYILYLQGHLKTRIVLNNENEYIIESLGKTNETKKICVSEMIASTTCIHGVPVRVTSFHHSTSIWFLENLLLSSSNSPICRTRNPLVTLTHQIALNRCYFQIFVFFLYYFLLSLSLHLHHLILSIKQNDDIPHPYPWMKFKSNS